MTAWILFFSLALAADAELPVDELTALGLDTPTTSSVAPGWRAALPAGGLVKAIEATDEAEAIAHFEWQKRTAQAGHWPAPATLEVDQVAGDGKASLLVRDGLHVIYVRDLQGHSKDWVERVRAVLHSGE